jgi:hypothetical protein
MVYEDAEAPFGIAYAPGDGYTGVTRGWPNSIDPSVHAVTLVGSCAYDFCPERVTISAARFDVGPLVGVNPVRRLPGVSLNELRTGWDATMGNETAPAERLRVDGEDALLVRSGDARAIVLTHRGWAYSIVYTGIRDLVGSTFLIEAASTIRFGYSVPPLDGSRIVFKEAHFAAVVPDDWKVLVNGESVSIGMRYGLGPTWDPTWTRYVLVASELTTLAAALAKAQDHGAVAGVLTFLAGDPGWLLTVPGGGRPPVALVEHGGRVFRFTVVDLQTPGVGATDLGRFLEGFEPLP